MAKRQVHFDPGLGNPNLTSESLLFRLVRWAIKGEGEVKGGGREGTSSSLAPAKNESIVLNRREGADSGCSSNTTLRYIPSHPYTWQLV